MSRALAINTTIETLELPAGVTLLPDLKWKVNRFQFVNSRGDATYVISQQRFNPETGKGGWWGCDCGSYVNARKDSDLGKTCKHLLDLGLVGNFVRIDVGELAVGLRSAPIGAKSLKNAEKKQATAAARAHLSALQGGASAPELPAADEAPAKPKRSRRAPAAAPANDGPAFLVTDKATYGIRDEIKGLGGKAHFVDGKFAGWAMPNQAAFDKVRALLDDGAKAVDAAPEPKALPACKPTGFRQEGDKIVVEFDAKDAAAVFALLAQIS